MSEAFIGKQTNRIKTYCQEKYGETRYGKWILDNGIVLENFKETTSTEFHHKYLTRSWEYRIEDREKGIFISHTISYNTTVGEIHGYSYWTYVSIIDGEMICSRAQSLDSNAKNITFTFLTPELSPIQAKWQGQIIK